MCPCWPSEWTWYPLQTVEGHFSSTWTDVPDTVKDTTYYMSSQTQSNRIVHCIRVRLYDDTYNETTPHKFCRGSSSFKISYCPRPLRAIFQIKRHMHINLERRFHSNHFHSVLQAPPLSWESAKIFSKNQASKTLDLTIPIFRAAINEYCYYELISYFLSWDNYILTFSTEFIWTVLSRATLQTVLSHIKIVL